jgi:hypothetical protein
MAYKRWLECKNTEPGPIERETICRFDTATGITRIDKTHASVAYTCAVAWSQTRTGVATFEQTSGTWHLVTPATTFADTFALQNAGPSADRPCPS